MKTTSKIKSVQGAGTFESPHGDDLGNGTTGFFKHDYEFEDGETLTANHKTKEPYKVGEEIEYQITKTTTYGKQGTVSKPFTSNNGGGYKPDQDAILYSVCLKLVGDHCSTHTDPSYTDQPFSSENINRETLEMAIEAKKNIAILKTHN